MGDQQAQRIAVLLTVPVEDAHGQSPVIVYADHRRAGGKSGIAHVVLPFLFLEEKT